MKVTHDGKVAYRTLPGSAKATPYQLNVAGTIEANIGRFTEIIVTSQSFVTSSNLIISGSNIFGTVGTDLHIFTGSLRVSGSDTFDNYFLNNVAIGKVENTHNIFEVQGSTTISNAITASDLTISNSGSFSYVKITGDLDVDGDTTIGGNLTFGNAPTDNISFAADIDSNFIPDDNARFNLGKNSQQWNKLFITDIHASALKRYKFSSHNRFCWYNKWFININWFIWFTYYTHINSWWFYDNWWDIRCNWCN